MGTLSVVCKALFNLCADEPGGKSGSGSSEGTAGGHNWHNKCRAATRCSNNISAGIHIASYKPHALPGLCLQSFLSPAAVCSAHRRYQWVEYGAVRGPSGRPAGGTGVRGAHGTCRGPAGDTLLVHDLSPLTTSLLSYCSRHKAACCTLPGTYKQCWC